MKMLGTGEIVLDLVLLSVAGFYLARLIAADYLISEEPKGSRGYFGMKRSLLNQHVRRKAA